MFDRTEAILACIIYPFALRQIAIGELLILAGTARQSIRQNSRLYENAIVGDGDTMFAWESWKEGGKLRYQSLLSDDGQIYAGEKRKPGSIVMAIRLETYLRHLR